MRITLTFSLLLLSLSGCIISSTIRKYPRGWPPLEATLPDRQCPRLAGIYAEWGDAPNGCHSGEEACRSLSYNLLGGSIGYKEIWDKNTMPRFPIGTHVELRQPSNTRLEIIQWRIEKDREEVVARKTLDSEKGDFTCTANGLKLRDRAVYFLAGLSNLVGSVSRRFSISENGDLVMQSIFGYMGHHVIFPGAHSFGIWIRWPARDPDMADSGK